MARGRDKANKEKARGRGNKAKGKARVRPVPRALAGKAIGMAPGVLMVRGEIRPAPASLLGCPSAIARPFNNLRPKNTRKSMAFWRYTPVSLLNPRCPGRSPCFERFGHR